MEVKPLLVVGDVFSTFAAKNADVNTVSEFKGMITNPPIGRYRLQIGQGVCHSDVKEIMAILGNSEYKNRFLMDSPGCLDFQKNINHQKNVHKHKPSNVMISPAISMGANCFSMSLRIQNECAELSDHTTGQHVQGMVLVEAARQAMLCVTEEYILDQNARHSSYFVLNNIQISFKKFAFPGEIDMRFVLSNLERKKGGTVKADSVTTFYHGSEELAEISINYTAYPKKYIEAKEDEMARLICSSLSSGLDNININSNQYVS